MELKSMDLIFILSHFDELFLFPEIDSSQKILQIICFSSFSSYDLVVEDDNSSRIVKRSARPQFENFREEWV